MKLPFQRHSILSLPFQILLFYVQWVMMNCIQHTLTLAVGVAVMAVGTLPTGAAPKVNLTGALPGRRVTALVKGAGRVTSTGWGSNMI